MASVAEDVGVAEGTVYMHFGSKAGLLIAVMGSYYDDLARDVEEIAMDPSPPDNRLQRLMDYWTGRMAEDWPLIRVFAQQGRYRSNTDIADALVDNNRRITRLVGVLLEELKRSGVFRADIPTRLLRDAIFGTLEHVQIGYHETGRPHDLMATPRLLMSLLLHGAAKHSGDEVEPLSATHLHSIEAKLDHLTELVNQSVSA